MTTQSNNEELIQAVERFSQKQSLMQSKLEVEAHVSEARILIDELEKKAQLELDDVELLNRDGLPRLFFTLLGKLETKLAKEQAEFDAAITKLEKAQDSYSILSEKYKKIQEELDDLVDANSTLELLALQISAEGADEVELLAIEVALTYLLINETEEKIAFGEQAEHELKIAQREIRLTQAPGPLASLNTSHKFKSAIKLLKNAEENLDHFNPDLNKEIDRLINIRKVLPAPNLDILSSISLLVAGAGSLAGAGLSIILSPKQDTNNSHAISTGELALEVERLRRKILKLIKHEKQEHAILLTKLIALDKKWRGFAKTSER